MSSKQIKYIKKKKCSNHPPEQVCNECIPLYVILNRQIDHHIDFV